MESRQRTFWQEPDAIGHLSMRPARRVLNSSSRLRHSWGLMKTSEIFSPLPPNQKPRTKKSNASTGSTVAIMDQGEYSTPSRASLLWGHLSGLFGAEALKRKYGASPPIEWEQMLRGLTHGQMQNGVQRLLASGAEHIPSLPQFLASCRDAREWEDRSTLTRLNGPQFDKWDIAGNQHFMAYVLTRLKQKRPLTEDETRIMVKCKNAWAEDMRADADPDTGMPVPQQKATWAECMANGEAECARIQAA